MVLAAGEEPRPGGGRIGTEAVGHRGEPREGIRDGVGGLVEVDDDAGGAGEAPGVAQQSVGDVHHRRGTGMGGGRPGVERGLRAQEVSKGVGDRAALRGGSGAIPRRGTGAAGPAPCRERGIATGTESEHAAVGDDVTGARTRAENGLGARAEGAVDGHGDDELLPRAEVPAVNAHPQRRARLREAAGEPVDPVHGRRRGQDEGDDERERLRAHGGDVGEVLHGRAPADVGGRAPVAAEVVTLDEDVGGHDDPPARYRDDGRVVAGGDEGLPAAWEEGDEGGDERVLAEVTDGAHARHRTVNVVPRRVRPVLLLPLALLAGCAPTVGLPPGEYAADPVCAEVLQATPDTLVGQERRSTSAQASTAWGDPALTLRCGVTPPGPTTERCLTVEQADGTAVDWIALEGDDELLPAHARRGQGSWTFVTYGRTPAVEVVVPVEHAGDQPTAPLVDLAAAMQVTTAERACVGLDDVTGPDGEPAEG